LNGSPRAAYIRELIFSRIFSSSSLPASCRVWKHVVAKSRELLELFRRGMKGFIKEMIAETTSMDAEKAASLTGSIDGLYGYASDLHHIVDNQGKVKEDIYTGGKEDAYMVYLISTSFVNLLRRKFIALTAKMNPRA